MVVAVCVSVPEPVHARAVDATEAVVVVADAVGGGAGAVAGGGGGEGGRHSRSAGSDTLVMSRMVIYGDSVSDDVPIPPCLN